ncbi:MAG: L,D-transpeptidase family protein [Anaerolineae bacterium]
MQSVPPDTNASPAVSESSVSRRGRARQRYLARQAKRQRRRMPSTSGFASGLDLEGLQFGRFLTPVINAITQVWAGFARQNLRGQATMLVLGFVALVAVFSLMSLNASGKILPGVRVDGVSVAGLSDLEASARLAETWASRTLTLRDGERTWTISPLEIGINLDTWGSIQEAVTYGRDRGLVGAISTVIGGADLEPVYTVDVDTARGALVKLAAEVNVAPRNASVRAENGVVIHVDAQPGRRLNINELLPALLVSPGDILRNGVIDLPMDPVPALITDAAPLVNYAQELLTRPLQIEAYDPVSDDSFWFTLSPEEWGDWLDTKLVFHETGPRLYLSAALAPVRDYLMAQAETLPEPLTLDLWDGVQAVQQAVADGSLFTWVTVRYKPVEYTVGRGETAYSISRTQGVPFYLIEQANPDIDLSQLFVGDKIILPSRDQMLPLRPVRNKRIIVDLSDQYLWAYEDGEVVYEWPISSGISSAPTWTGVYQILSHVDVAYGSSYTLCDENTCGQWKMHWFMGIYEVVPGLVNGFHGAVELPNGGYLGGGQVGRPYTFGCIMSLEENAKLLYDWAEEGVVVEIRQ